MKFLCVPCDEAMSLVETRGPDEGSMTVIFRCPACERETAMLTNSMETQVVHSLGVEIKSGDRAAAEKADSAQSKCPFTGVVADAYSDRELTWTEGARSRAERIPVFARRMAMKGIEDYAQENGYREISEAVLDEARGHLGL